jgi:UDP-N-acetylglucosamine/UDP-N-acetylgalactosamine diphosphorylase
LPWHVAHKIVPFIDVQTGELVEPSEPNAYKYERFVFDVLPLATTSLVVETKREDEFAPIKNAIGNDSVQTSQQLQKERAASWLQINGVQVSSTASVEISPLTAASARDLAQVELPDSVDDNEVLSM